MTVELSGFFEISTNEIFGKITEDFEKFSKSNSQLDLLDLILWLRHLSEWVSLESEESVNFTNELNQKQCFKTLISLCNRSKHHTLNRGRNPGTSIARGGQAGLFQAGDRLGQNHFLANGEDIRLILNEVYNEYKKYFNAEAIAS